MPIYEFVCPQCKERLETFASMKEHEKGLKPVCPRCGSKRMIQVFGGFSIGSSRKASGKTCPPSAGPGCCR